MDVLEAIRARRAVKRFDAAHEMTAEERRTLLEHAMMAPTAFNIQHWRFVLVTDKALREQVRAAAWNQPQVTEASLLVVLCADVAAWEKEPARYWSHIPPDSQALLLGNIDAYYRGKPQVQRDEIMRSCGIVAQTIMLAAKGMGYDSCPMDGFDFTAVGRLIGLPADHEIGLMVAVGKAAAVPPARGGKLPADLVVIEDRFG